MSIIDIFGLFKTSVQNPRQGAHDVLGLDLPRQARWIFLALVVVLNVIFGEVLRSLIPPLPLSSNPTPTEVMIHQVNNITPLNMAVIIGCLLVVFIFSVLWTGRAIGGAGQLSETVVLVSWWQLVLLALEMIVLLIAAAIPFVGSFLLLAFVGYAVASILVFIDVIHKFNSVGKAFVLLVMAGFGILIGLGVMGSLFGLSVEAELARV